MLASINKEEKIGISRISFLNHVRLWVKTFDELVIYGLKHNSFNKQWTVEQRFDLVAKVLSGDSITNVAKNAHIDSGLLYQWVKKYREKGMDGLKCSNRGRPCKNMEPENQEIQAPAEPIRPTEDEPQTLEEALLENRRLKEKLLYKEARELYLKKLDALVEERERQERLKKHARLLKSSKARKSK